MPSLIFLTLLGLYPCLPLIALSTFFTIAIAMNIRPHAFPLFVAALLAAAAVESRSTSALHRRGVLGNDPSKMSG